MLKFSCLAPAWLLTGCLYSVHHFNTGVALPAGRTETTLGAGRQAIWSCEHAAPDSTGRTHACGDSAGESVGKSAIFKGSVDFRLGLKDSLGPFSAAELEWRMEGPTSPATMEFALNVGLPARSSYHHKVGLGWGIGAWADNSFYLEYGASARAGLPLFFGNMRVTYLATQIGEVMGQDFASPLPSRRHLVWQAGAGVSLRLPAWPVAPDFVIPQLNLTLPQVPPGEGSFRAADIPRAQWDMNLGFGWTL